MRGPFVLLVAGMVLGAGMGFAQQAGTRGAEGSGAVAADAATPAESAGGAAAGAGVAPAAEPQGRRCNIMNLDVYGVWSKTAVEDYIAEQIIQNYRSFGKIDWKCIMAEFRAQSPLATVLFLRNGITGEGGGPGSYGFTVDRSGNLFAVLRSIGPGASNGVFTAIVSIEEDGSVAIIKRGGKDEWLKLE